ncbi:TAXI family TRAP transporter solute-binding subunit [Synergistaceae bacterium OttesenSCG-928-I11]|nr:TAXI family TRAP transporter solute-binding subunit [Synergistaceae bacterium OttesenSCG-928-I11]
MKGKITAIVAGLLLAVFATGTNMAQAASHTLAFGTAASTNTYYLVGAAVASLINKYIDGVECNVEVTSGVQENLTLVMKGEAQLGMADSDVLQKAYKGEREFKGKDYSRIRVLMSGHSTYHYFYTPESSQYKSLRDVKGARISLGVRGAAAYPYLEKLLENLGIDVYKDAKHFYMTNGEQVAAMVDGKLDVGRCGSGVPAAPMIEVTNSIPVRFLEITEEDVQELNKSFPLLVPAVVPAGTYKGQDKDYHTMRGVSYIVVRDDMSDDLVVRILDAIVNHNEELKAINIDAGQYNPENAATNMDILGVPFHPAAERYWKDKGVF